MALRGTLQRQEKLTAYSDSARTSDSVQGLGREQMQ